ncbi:unnamed protein product [[Candida] boidinii]|uniref:Unnamed protein product n=1 Tax=Candida boidinii TaxID=5477 RepID=A0A9W6SUD2_CANBO|nr:hypothetical protein B5S30_g1024 [[Candida] boidinii]OWB86354.1 hypothetical protein B5S33_g5042 [[Candida] boidinii]GME66985.1 unnamed protein product [[Candida] boidinii]
MSKYIPLPSERQGTDDSFSRSPKRLTERLGLRGKTTKSLSESRIGLLDSVDTNADSDGNYRQDKSLLFENGLVENNLQESANTNKKSVENETNGIISIGNLIRGKNVENSDEGILKLQRKSSVIIPSTGQKVKRSYSFFNQTVNNEAFDENEDESENENNYPGNHDLLTNYNTEVNAGHLPTTILPPTNDSVPITTVAKRFNIKEIFTWPTTKGVLKASIAYLIASIFVYCTPIANLLGSSDSKHLVCTTVVYFPSAKTKGAMLQSLLFAVIAILFSFTVSVSTMSLSAVYYNKDLPEVCYGIDLLSCCFTLGIISFAKQYVNKPTFNTACSLAAISTISSIVKEGSKDGSIVPWKNLKSIFLIVSIGCMCSVIVCYVFHPTSAELDLKKGLIEDMDQYAKLLKKISKAFLTSGDVDTKEINDLMADSKKNFGKLDTALEHSYYEMIPFGKEKEFLLLSNLVQSSKKVQLSLFGLKRSAEFRTELLNYEKRLNGYVPSNSDEILTLNSFDSNKQMHHNHYYPRAYQPQFQSSSSFNDDTENDEDDEDTNEINANIVALDSKELFDLFVFHLGPSMKSFSFTMTEILKRIPFNNNKEFKIYDEVFQYNKSLKLALNLFNQNHEKAIGVLYEQDLFKREADLDTKIDQEEVAASCGNFSYMLSDVCKEVESYLDILEEYHHLQKHPSEYKSFEFLKFWKYTGDFLREVVFNSNTESNDLQYALMKYQRRRDEKSDKSSIGYRLWSLTKFVRRVDVQFGFRVGVGAFFIAIFAYLDLTKNTFVDWRGEWALVTYSIIMNKSLGGTNMTVKWRFIGVGIGCVVAYYVWVIFSDYVLLMALCGFLFSMPCFYIILYWKQNNAFGRFILLTYNLTILYSYTMSQKPEYDLPDYDDEGGSDPFVFEIAWHRYVGVSLGVIWAVVISLTLFPNSARSRIRKGLSLLWLRMGLIWNFGPLEYSHINETNENRFIGIKDRKKIHDIMNELEALIKQAPMEIRLKGSFPTEIYQVLLKSTNRIIDAFENMNSIIEFDTLVSDNEKRVLDILKPEMNELEHRIFLIFYMLASAMKLGFPLANKPASTEHAMDRMLIKLGEIRDRNYAAKELLKNEDYIYLYSYILVSNSITNELDVLLKSVAELYGRLSQDDLDL